MARTYGKAQDLIDFTRASSGTCLRRVKYGAELVTNGTFDADSDWTLGTGWTISGGKLVGTSVPNFTVANQSIALEAGKVYQLTIVVSESSGGTVRAGFLNGTTVLATDNIPDARTVTANVIALTGNDKVFIGSAGSGFTGSIDSISVKEVTFDTSDGDLLLFNHPNNIPRIEYDADGNLLGLLVEESRTNLFNYSLISQATWPVNNVSLTANTTETLAPDGTYTASKVIADAANTICYFNKDVNITSGTTYTQSIYAKAGETSWLQIAPSTGFDTVFQNYDLANGVLGYGNAGGIASITPVGDGWYRCTLTVTAIVTTSNGRMVFAWMSGDDGRVDSDGTFSPDGVKGFYAWGAQLEVGSFPTSYIPTSGSTATRSADVASIGVDGFGYRQDEGTVVVDLRYNGVGTSPRILCFSDGTNTNRIVLDRIPMVTVVNNNSVTVSDATTSSSSVLTPYKVGLSLSDSNTSITIDGETPSTSSGTIPKVISKLIIGDGQTSPRYINGHIKSLRYYPRALTNAQLQELTS